MLHGYIVPGVSGVSTVSGEVPHGTHPEVSLGGNVFFLLFQIQV